MTVVDENSVESLLAKWEEVYKKGLLSFWLLLYLDDKPSYAYEISRELENFSEGTMSADENSIYRALNRFESMGVLRSELIGSDIGPSRKYYNLTEVGSELLKRFILRNVAALGEDAVKSRIASVIK